MNSTVFRSISSVAGFAVLVTSCAVVPEAYPPPANPFLSGAPSIEGAKNLPPTKVGLVWLKPSNAAAPPEAAQRVLIEKIKAQFATGKRLEIVGSVTVAAADGDTLAGIRKASASFTVQQVLVVMPQGIEVVSPAWLPYGRDGRAVGTRTDSYFTVSLVALDLASGKRLFSAVANGEARLLAPDYEDARPWYPRISPGRTSDFIYPDKATFPAGEVHAVALRDAVNGLIYKLDLALGS
jgi:outer membrane protein TolC